MNRKEMIDDIATDIADGHAVGGYATHQFIDILLDEDKIDCAALAVLLNGGEWESIVKDGIRGQVKEEAVKFFTDGLGSHYIDDRMAEQRAEAESDAEFERKYGRAAP